MARYETILRGTIPGKEGRELLCTVRKARPLPPSSGLAKNLKVFTSIRALREHLVSNKKVNSKSSHCAHFLLPKRSEFSKSVGAIEL